MSLKYKEQTTQICEFFFLQGHSTVLHKDNSTIWGFIFLLLGGDCLAEKLTKIFCYTEIVKKNYLKIINHTSAEVMKGLDYTHKSREEKGKN